MGRFYKTTGGQYKDFMYQPDMESNMMVAQAEMKNEAIKQQYSDLQGLSERKLLEGYNDDYNSHVTGFNEQLQTGIDTYRKSGDKSILDNLIKQGKQDFSKESVYGKQRDKSAAVFDEHTKGLERNKSLKGNAKAAADADVQRYLDGEQLASTKQDAEAFEAQTYKDYVDQQKDLDDNFDATLMTDNREWENQGVTGMYEIVENADGTTSSKEIAKLPVGHRTALRADGTIHVVNADGEPAPEYGVTSAVEFTPALNSVYQSMKTTNKFKGVNLPATLNWAYQKNMNSAGWVANERQTYDIKRNLNGGFVKLEDVTDEEALANYKSAAEKREKDKKAELTVEEDMAFNTIVADEKDYLEKRAAQEAQIFIGNKKGVTTSVTTKMYEDKIKLDNAKNKTKSKTTGKTPEEVKENLNYIQEAVLANPEHTAAYHANQLGLNMNNLNESYTATLDEGTKLVENKEELRLAMGVEGLSPTEKLAAQTAYYENEKKITANKLEAKRSLQIKNEVTNAVNLGNVKFDNELKEEIRTTTDVKDRDNLIAQQNVVNKYRDINGDIENPLGEEKTNYSILKNLEEGDTELIEDLVRCAEGGYGCSQQETELSQNITDALGNGEVLQYIREFAEFGTDKNGKVTLRVKQNINKDSHGIDMANATKLLSKVTPFMESLNEQRDFINGVKKEYEGESYLNGKSEEFAKDLAKEKTGSKTTIDLRKTKAQGNKETKEWAKQASKTLLSDISGGDGINITINPEDDPDNIYTSLLTDNKGSDAEILFLDLDDAGVIEATALIGDKEVRFTFDSAEIAGESTTKKLVDGIERLNKDQLDTNSTKVLSSVLDVRSYKSKYKENTTIYETDENGYIQYDETTAYTKASQEFIDVLDSTPIGGQFASAQGKFIYLSQRNDGDTWSTTILNNDEVTKQGVVDLQELYDLPQEQIESMKVKSTSANSPGLTAVATPTLSNWLARDKVNYGKAQEEARVKALNNKTRSEVVDVKALDNKTSAVHKIGSTQYITNDIEKVKNWLKTKVNETSELPLSAEEFKSIAEENDYPLPLLLAQALQESSFGTKGAATATNNMFNVGNVTAGDSKTREQAIKDGDRKTLSSWKKGVQNYIDLMKKQYMPASGDWSELLEPGSFVNHSGNRYAADKGYETSLKSILKQLQA